MITRNDAAIVLLSAAIGTAVLGYAGAAAWLIFAGLVWFIMVGLAITMSVTTHGRPSRPRKPPPVSGDPIVRSARQRAKLARREAGIATILDDDKPDQ